MAVTRSGLSGIIGSPIGRTGRYVYVMARRPGIGARLYWFRAWDSGTGGWVTWGPSGSPALGTDPVAALTTPNYTGTLSQHHVWLTKPQT